MVRKFLKKIVPNPKLFKDVANPGVCKTRYPALWCFNRDTVARGVAVGLFAAMIPILPFQTILAIFLSIILRANLASALIVSWVSNPLTIIPLAYLTYKIGGWVLNEPAQKFELSDISWNFKNMHEMSETFNAWILQFGKPFFVGLPILALSAALLGYILVLVFWRVYFYLKNK